MCWACRECDPTGYRGTRGRRCTTRPLGEVGNFVVVVRTHNRAWCPPNPTVEQHEVEVLDRNVLEHQRPEVPDQVLGFLATTGDPAFKAHEIASQIGVNEGAVSTAFTTEGPRPSERKAMYWAVTDGTERLEGYSGYERAIALFSERLGEEDKES